MELYACAYHRTNKMMRTLVYVFLLTIIGLSGTQGQVISEPDDVTVCEGRSTTFTCVLDSSISSDDVQWYRLIEDTSITERVNQSNNIHFNTSTVNNTLISNLTITDVLKFYSGYYWVRLLSGDVCNVSLTVATKPSTLTVNITKNTETLSVFVQWDEVDDSLHTIFTVTWSSERDHIPHPATIEEQSSYTITGLTLDTVYTISVIAANRCGAGPEYSNSVSLTSYTTSTSSSSAVIASTAVSANTIPTAIVSNDSMNTPSASSTTTTVNSYYNSDTIPLFPTTTTMSIGATVTPRDITTITTTNTPNTGTFTISSVTFISPTTYMVVTTIGPLDTTTTTTTVSSTSTSSFTTTSTTAASTSADTTTSTTSTATSPAAATSTAATTKAATTALAHSTVTTTTTVTSPGVVATTFAMNSSTNTITTTVTSFITNPTTTTLNNSTDVTTTIDDGSGNAGGIAGGVVGGIAVLLIILFSFLIVFYLFYVQKRKKGKGGDNCHQHENGNDIAMIKDVPSVSNPLAMAVIVDEEEEPEKPCDPGNENASTGFFYTAKEHRNSLIFVDDSESIKEISEKPPVTHYQTVGLKKSEMHKEGDCGGHNHDLHQVIGDNSIVYHDQDASSLERVNDDSTHSKGPPTTPYDVPRTRVNNISNPNQSPPNDRYSTPRPSVRNDAPPSHDISAVYAVVQKNSKNKNEIIPCKATPVDQYATPSNRVRDDITADGNNDQYAVPYKKAKVDKPSPNESPYVALSNGSNYANLRKKDKVDYVDCNLLPGYQNVPINDSAAEHATSVV